MNRGRHTRRAAPPTGVSLFEVVVGGGIGFVYRGWDEIAANEFFDIYVALSASGDTRAADESVQLVQDGQVARYFVGALDVIRDWRARGVGKLAARQYARFGTWDDCPAGFKRRLIDLVDRVY